MLINLLYLLNFLKLKRFAFPHLATMLYTMYGGSQWARKIGQCFNIVASSRRTFWFLLSGLGEDLGEWPTVRTFILILIKHNPTLFTLLMRAVGMNTTKQRLCSTKVTTLLAVLHLHHHLWETCSNLCVFSGSIWGSPLRSEHDRHAARRANFLVFFPWSLLTCDRAVTHGFAFATSFKISVTGTEVACAYFWIDRALHFIRWIPHATVATAGSNGWHASENCEICIRVTRFHRNHFDHARSVAASENARCVSCFEAAYKVLNILGIARDNPLRGTPVRHDFKV